MRMQKETVTTREFEATEIPSGMKIKIPEGTPLGITSTSPAAIEPDVGASAIHGTSTGATQPVEEVSTVQSSVAPPVLASSKPVVALPPACADPLTLPGVRLRFSDDRLSHRPLARPSDRGVGGRPRRASRR